ncbi:MAG: HepT-like ribonuclease domain-containing protein, partial [Microcystaceae cyanobacterium]
NVMKDARIYLIHIRECLTRIENYTQNGQNDFMNNILIQDAVLRNLEVMGESIKQLPEEWKASQPNIEWVKIGDFRNVLAQDYLRVDLDVVWTIIASGVTRQVKSLV